MYEQTVPTMAGVLSVGDPEGVVTVKRGDGDTMASLTVVDSKGEDVTVYLDYYQVTRLMVSLGTVASYL